MFGSFSEDKRPQVGDVYIPAEKGVLGRETGAKTKGPLGGARVVHDLRVGWRR